MEFKVPENVYKIIEELHRNNYEAYAVGGCVRDKLLGREPKDWDITTSAMPNEVKLLFNRTVDTGIKHGTVTVLLEQSQYEVTTYRIDGDYVDNRHPEEVSFTKKLEEDLKRRDFTINAMAYNETDGLVDIFGGQEDLKAKIVRCVGDPNERFNEDALRMLRAIRFSAQLGFEIEEETYKAIKANSHLIRNISAERIRDEITKIIMSNNPSKFMLLYDAGLLEYIIPEFIANINCPQNSPWHKYTVDEHIMQTVCNIENRLDLRWTMLLHDIAKAPCRTTDEKGYDHFAGHPVEGAVMANEILNRLKFDNKTIRKVTRLIKYHDHNIPLDERELRKTIAMVGEDIFEDLLKVMNADDAAKAEIVWIESREKNEALKKIYEKFKMNGYCLNKNDLKVSGDDLIECGFKQGIEIGDMLDFLFEKVLIEPKLNDKFELINLAKKEKEKIINKDI